MRTEMIFTEQDYERAKEYLLQNEQEQFCFALGGINKTDKCTRILVRTLIIPDSSCLESQTPTRIVPKPQFIQHVWHLAKESNSSLINMHSHPFSSGSVRFSCIDDASDSQSFPKEVEALGSGPHVSMVFGQNSVYARWYDEQSKAMKAFDRIRVIGESSIEILPTSSPLHNAQSGSINDTLYNRQVLAFGPEGQLKISDTTVGIIGAGGMGAEVFVKLVRLGVANIIISDFDKVESTNLNRLAGSTLRDAAAKTKKVDMLKNYAMLINPKINVTALDEGIESEAVQKAMKSCDILFGCTDNESSRFITNNLSARYMIPYIDTGTGINSVDGAIIDAGGQVRISLPGMGCLNCIDGIDLNTARQEMLPEDQRNIAIQRGYIAGEDVKAPAVASLNGVIANLAVTEFMGYVTGCKPVFRYVFYDFMKATTFTTDFPSFSGCSSCSPYSLFGAGDSGKCFPEGIKIYDINQKKGTQTMENNIETIIASLIDNAKNSGFEIEGIVTDLVIILKDVVLGQSFSRESADVKIEFDLDNQPQIYLSSSASLYDNEDVCPHFLSRTKGNASWQKLCPCIFSEIASDEMFEFIVCLSGFLANPNFCGLMGCSMKDETTVQPMPLDEARPYSVVSVEVVSEKKP